MVTPKVLYPTLKVGFIEGPIRCESLDGSELWLPPQEGKLSIPPFERDGKIYCVSHLQKRSKSFSLLYDPFIYHYGKFWKLQDGDGRGTWIPGSENGVYWRTPGWRWQALEASPWVFSKGYFGFHLD